MFSIPHLIVIFVVALIIFGPEKLPELARNLGKVMGEFRTATGDLQSTFEGHRREIERDAAARRIGGGTPATLPGSAPDGQPSGVPGDQGSPSAALPPAAAGGTGEPGPNVSAAQGLVPSKPPNAAAIEQRNFDLFTGVATEPLDPENSEPSAEASTPADSSTPEYPHQVTDAGLRQS